MEKKRQKMNCARSSILGYRKRIGLKRKRNKRKIFFLSCMSEDSQWVPVTNMYSRSRRKREREKEGRTIGKFSRLRLARSHLTFKHSLAIRNIVCLVWYYRRKKTTLSKDQDTRESIDSHLIANFNCRLVAKRDTQRLNYNCMEETSSPAELCSE